MAQLIKLQDYISRYEKDIYHYPGQFIRLKKENWTKLLQTWEIQMEEQKQSTLNDDIEKESNFYKWKHFFQRREKLDPQEKHVYLDRELPETIEELKQYFLDSLLPFQLKWASTTVSEMSFLDKTYYHDFTLKYFLQRFPDTFLLLYNPIFQLKKSPVEGDIVLISPVGIEIINMIEFGSHITIIAGNDRVWFKEERNVQTRMLSPLLSLKRTEKIIRSVFQKYDVELPINKVVLSRTNDIEFNTEPNNTTYIGKEAHEAWLNEKRTFVSPLKHRQLKIAEYILNHAYTSAINRPEWEDEID